MKISEQVACYLIDVIPFLELCEHDKGNPRIINEGNKFLGYLSYDKNNILGKGTFKTAHLASLKWILSSPSNGLGAKISEPIAVAMKRPYDDSKQSGNVKHFNYADESCKVITEGTLLGWAKSLLQFAYAFINDFIAKQTPSEAPFNIPQLRFVKGAITYSEKSLDHTAKVPSALSHHAAYLLEELLPLDQPFIKYIHNAEAIPLQEQDEPGYEMGVFLCFIQHVQFVYTHGQAYVSDFQGLLVKFQFKSTILIMTIGAGNLLTDPQVMTHPYVSQFSPDPLSF